MLDTKKKLWTRAWKIMGGDYPGIVLYRKRDSTLPLSPIAVFAYQRPNHLKALLDSLSRCPEASDSELYIFVDGPKAETDRGAVSQTLGIANQETRFRSVEIQGSERNLGLSESITSGITRVLSVHDSIIVLEDDLLVSTHFLRYMNDALTLYKSTDEVISVHAYVYPIKKQLPSTFFIRGADCWGWGTWRRGWALYNPDSQALFAALNESGERQQFDFNGSYRFSEMLRDQCMGKIDSWAVRWYASAFLAKKLTLYPNTPLAVNTGLDGSGTHGTGHKTFENYLSESPLPLEWVNPVENQDARHAFEEFLQPGRIRKIRNRAQKILKLLFQFTRGRKIS